MRTFIAIRQVNPGFDVHNVLTMRMSLTGPQFENPASVSRVIQDGLRRIRALPGVENAATGCCVPGAVPRRRIPNCGTSRRACFSGRRRYFAYNFIRIHRTLRVTPAMAAGVTDRLFDVSDMVLAWLVFKLLCLAIAAGVMMLFICVGPAVSMTGTSPSSIALVTIHLYRSIGCVCGLLGARSTC